MDKYLTDALNQLAAYKGTEIALIEGRGFLTIILISLLTSLFISALYLYFYENRSTGSRIHRSFPLLGVSVTTLFVCIQFSLPLSLGLLGALSIVRFRTPIKEPEEIGFIMLVIAASIACATANFKFLGILLGIAVLALLAMRFGPKKLKDPMAESMITVTLPTADFDAQDGQLQKLVEESLGTARLQNISSSSGTTSISYGFARASDQKLQQLQQELRRISGACEYNIYMNRQGLI